MAEKIAAAGVGSVPVETAEVETSQGRFRVARAGREDAPLVMLLHGFPQSRHSWRAQLPALAHAGWRAVAPDQRGYSPGVRPDPADLSRYTTLRLVRDALELADACTAPGAPFHLVGHDWGGQIAWCTAALHPDRIASLTVLSRPHPGAFRRAYQQDDDAQQQRSRHHRRFQDPATTSLLLADGARRLRRLFSDQRVPADAVELYLSVLGTPDAMEAAVAWYRAAGALSQLGIGPVQTPTLYLWGDADATVGPSAAHATRHFIKAPYRFETLRGVGHFITDEVPARVSELLLEHLESTRSAGPSR